MNNNKKSFRLSVFIIHLLLMLFCLACVLPILIIVSASLTDENSIYTDGYGFVPKVFSTFAYKVIFSNPIQVFQSYLVTITVTAAGGIIGLMVVSMLAYSLSRQDYRLRGKLSFYVFFTMLFNGGLVPYYILISRYLHWKDTWIVLVIPTLVNAFYILLLRTFFQKVPTEIIESARIDGSGEYRTFFSIVLPLSKSGLATIGLFIVLGYWNDWFTPLLFINDKNLIPLQYLLYQMMANIQFLNEQIINSPIRLDIDSMPSESVRMAMCIIAAGPMLFMFPFFQKYFVKGLTVGALKG